MTVDLMEIAKHTKYPVEAFVFVQKGLDFTVKRLHGEDPHESDGEASDQTPAPGLVHGILPGAMLQQIKDQPDRHVSGQQLCMGLRDFAIDQYGLLARAVLKRWHIHRSEDFGAIVFAMVEAGLMFKTDRDTINDFRGVFEFADAFSPSLVFS